MPTPEGAQSPPRRLSREEARQQTRERLLDAAAVVFKRQGYNGASLEAVAEAAGYTKGAVYSNFATKADLFVALLQRYLDAEVALQGAQFESSTLEESLDGLDAIFRRQVADDPLWVVLQIEFWLAAVRDPAIRETVVAAGIDLRRQSGESIDAELAAAGLTPPFSGMELSILLNALATGLAIQFELDPDSVDPRLLTRAARRMIGLNAREGRDSPS
jgi:AcrR family transcriptional regulator